LVIQTNFVMRRYANI